MSTPTGDNVSMSELKVEVKAELVMAESSHPEEVMEQPITEWLFDPVEAEEEAVELRGLLGAVESLEDTI